MGVLRDYLQGMSSIGSVGEAVAETSYYGQLEALLNAAGDGLAPKVMCVLTTRNRGAGVPDGGLFIRSRAAVQAGSGAMTGRMPERGVIEAKGVDKNVRQVARSAQVQRYLRRYGKVLVTTYREFLVVTLGEDGTAAEGELFTLAGAPEGFWDLARSAGGPGRELEERFEAYLRRALMGDAQLSQPADLAWFLAAYAREGRRRLDTADARHLRALQAIRGALEDALGLRFEGPDGENFFRSALVQTLFYGVFAAWVVWCEANPPGTAGRFRWKSAQWTLNVPMVRVLFQQLATPATLPVGLDEVLDWTEDALARVDRALFFERFASGSAVQYFYEPFLQEYDPGLRRQLGVWYTPPEVVRYMVARVHEALQQDLGLELGLADENVHVLDPCTGTGSFLVECIATVTRVLRDRYGDELVGQDVKAAAMSRIHGFELLPAPFVIAHLNVGLALDTIGAPLGDGERARVYLTNALTGWVESGQHPRLPFPEFEEERDAAEEVKRAQPILVVLGNPPYNGFAGVSEQENGHLVEPYKAGLAETWDITKNNLDDLYVRFFRVAERRIAEQTGKGIVCFISNFSWLADPSAVVMRQRLVTLFDRLYIDNLNGDSRETGKHTPDGDPDPSVFSTRLNREGIQVGTAVAMLVRQDRHDDAAAAVSYRDFWGAGKRAELEASRPGGPGGAPYAPLSPAPGNWYRLRPWSPRQGYEQWPSVAELAAEEPALGLNENRGEALIDHDRAALEARMTAYLDPSVKFGDLAADAERLTYNWARFDPQGTRERLLQAGGYSPERVTRFQVKPFDLRWAYVDTTRKLWNEPRAEYVRAAAAGSNFLLVRRRAPRALDGAAFLLSRCLIDQHVMHKDAYVIPFWLAPEASEPDPAALFDVGPEPDGAAWRPNLSARALGYLSGLGITDAGTSQASASLLWQHALAVGYSPLYLEENGDAIRSHWPRIPLPPAQEQLRASALLGQQVADLLDVDFAAPGLDPAVQSSARAIARLGRADGTPLAPASGDLALTAGWATEQARTQRSGAVSRIVMPSRGRIQARPWSQAERAGLADEHVALLGNEVVDVYLHDRACWHAAGRVGLQGRRVPGPAQVALLPRQEHPRKRPDGGRGPPVHQHLHPDHPARAARSPA
jgi:Type ISP C-terminal specificity domain/N-6 DNA Methylase